MTAVTISPTPRLSASRSNRRSPVVQRGRRALQARICRLLDNEIDFIPNASFREAGAEEEILPADRPPVAPPSDALAPRELPAHLARMCDAALLSAKEERQLFRRMNYLKFRANVIRSQLDPERPDARAANRLEVYLREATAIRDHIIRANLRLVISIVKKFVNPQFAFDDLLSDGIVSLMQAVDKFDYDRGFRFSTYAYRAIARNAYRTITQRQKENSRVTTGTSEVLASVADTGDTSSLSENEWSSMRAHLSDMMECLDRRERFIIRGRFALGAHRKVRTFQSLADKLGVSKERVRQLEQRAVAKLRAMAVEGALEC